MAIPTLNLPEPSTEDQARSLALTDAIKQAIVANDGQLSFSHFMTLLLYHPAFGYYTAKEFTLGKQGDFITAPELSPLFAECFASQCQTILQQPKMRTILEIGPGTGKLACDLLSALKSADCLPDKYYLYEISKNLRDKQYALLHATHPTLADSIEWLDELPQPFDGIIIANEVLDALPVDCFEVKDKKIYERCVAWGENAFNWQLAPASPTLTQQVAALSLPDGYQSEINLALPDYIKRLCHCLRQGIIFLADYGYGQREYYHPERVHGTLTCFYKHHQHQNPLVLPGLQDVTTHVDFTRVIESASQYGCSLLGYTTQAGFLLANGLLDFVKARTADASPKDEFEIHQAVKLLTLPTEMGERIKVMALGKGMEVQLDSFKLQDRRREL